MSGPAPAPVRLPWQPREIIERLPGGYLVDWDGRRSIETTETVASRILRIWPDVALHIAAAWRAVNEEEMREIIAVEVTRE